MDVDKEGWPHLSKCCSLKWLNPAQGSNILPPAKAQGLDGKPKSKPVLQVFSRLSPGQPLDSPGTTQNSRPTLRLCRFEHLVPS